MKEPTPDQIKDLIINGILYCKYHIDNGILFIKIINQLSEYTIEVTEQFCYNVISSIEAKELNGMAYLNI